MPGVSIVIISISISHAVVPSKLTQGEEVFVSNLKANTEQVSPCPWISFRKVCTVGIIVALFWREQRD